MKLIIKTYETMRSSDIILQEEIVDVLTIDQDMTTFHVATFTIGAHLPLNKGNRIDIYEAIASEDKKIFSWYIYETNPVRQKFDRVEVVCRSRKGFLGERRVLLDQTYTGDIAHVLEQILSHYNAMGDNRQVHSSVTKNITQAIAQKDIYLDVIDDIIIWHGLQREVDDGVIVVAEQIWVDRSQWSLYQEAYFDNRLINKGNIEKISLKNSWEQGNILIADDIRWNTSVDTSLVDGYVTGVVFKQFREWNLATKKAQAIKTLNKPKRSYTVELRQWSLMADIGDKILLRVEWTNPYYDIDSAVTIIKKKITYKNATKYESCTLWEIITAPFTFDRRMHQIEKSISMLKL